MSRPTENGKRPSMILRECQDDELPSTFDAVQDVNENYEYYEKLHQLLMRNKRINSIPTSSNKKKVKKPKKTKTVIDISRRILSKKKFNSPKITKSKEVPENIGGIRLSKSREKKNKQVSLFVPSKSEKDKFHKSKKNGEKKKKDSNILPYLTKGEISTKNKLVNTASLANVASPEEISLPQDEPVPDEEEPEPVFSTSTSGKLET